LRAAATTCSRRSSDEPRAPLGLVLVVAIST
jgi:hypothetical protein